MSAASTPIPEPVRWHSRDHLHEAHLAHRGDVNALREERLIDAKEEHPEHFERCAPEQRRQFRPARRLGPGDHVGSLTLVARDSRVPQRGWLWRTRCDCGRGERLILTSDLMHAVRKGVEPACATCTRERRAERAANRRGHYHDAFRRQWVDYRTLWREGQTRTLMLDVADDLAEAFGPVLEPTPAFRGSIPTTTTYGESAHPNPSAGRCLSGHIEMEDVAPLKVHNGGTRRLMKLPVPQHRGSGWSTTAQSEVSEIAWQGGKKNAPRVLRSADLENALERSKACARLYNEYKTEWHKVNPAKQLDSTSDRQLRQVAFFVAYSIRGTEAARRAAYAALSGLGQRKTRV